MDLALELWARQLGLLVALTALGSGPASILPGVPAVVRIAVAPALGLALGAAILVSAAYLMPMSTAGWVVMLPLAVASAGFAFLRLRGSHRPLALPGGREVAALGALAVAVIAAVDAPLIEERSLGPMGYAINDSAYLVAQHRAMQDHALGDIGINFTAGELRKLPPTNRYFDLSRAQRREYRDLYHDHWRFFPAGFAAVAAGVDGVLGWHSVDTQTGYLGVLVLVAALGGFALARQLTRSLPAALLAGILIVGPLGYQLYIESAEGARSALALLCPLGLVGVLLWEQLRASLVALFGLLFAGLMAVYSLWVPAMVLSVMVALGGIAAVTARRGRLRRRSAARVLAALGGAALVSVIVAPAAIARGIGYEHLIGTTEMLDYLLFLGMPVYQLPVQVLPGWILQTRELYSLAPPGIGELGAFGRAFVVPLLLLGLAGYGAWAFRARGALLLLAPLPVVAVLGFQLDQGETCSYCVQRQLVMLGPSAAVLTAAGLAALPLAAGTPLLERVGLGRRGLIGLAVAAGLLALALASQKSIVLAQRALDNDEILDSRIRDLTNDLDAGSGPVLLEAPGAGGVQLPATYWAVQDATGARPAIEPRTEGFLSIASFYESDPQLKPGPRSDFRLVLTRMRGIRTDRRTLDAAGPFALQYRAHPFDVNLLGGALADVAHDPRAFAWVLGRLRFEVFADGRGPAWLRLELRGRGVASLSVGGSARLHRRNRSATVCVPVQGRGARRGVEVPLSFDALPPTAVERYALSLVPGKSLRLAGMKASGRPCA